MNSLTSELNSLERCDCQQVLCRCGQTKNAYFQWKGWIDRAIALLLLVPAIPVIGLLVLLIRLTSKGPGIYSQTRVGKGGRIFTMFKLRSMRIDAESTTGPVWAGVNSDRRVTRVGYWLRRLHLDELPQFYNVLRGDMSLVGPRPERPEFVRVLGEQVPGYLQRLRIAPGITGLAQVNLPPDSDLESVRRKIVLDCAYIDQASFGLDLRLILCTALRVFGWSDRRAAYILGLRRNVESTSTDAGLPQNAPVTPETIAAPSESNSPAGRRRDPGRSGLSRARSPVNR